MICKILNCQFCNSDQNLTRHHLYPRETHKTQWFIQKKLNVTEQFKTIKLCEDCHTALHDMFSNAALGRRVNSLEKLLNHDSVKTYLFWKKHRNFCPLIIFKAGKKTEGRVEIVEFLEAA